MAVLAVLVLGIAFLAVLYSLNKKNSTVKTSTGQILQKLPGVPFWSLFIMSWRYTSFLRHVGLLNRICQLRFWKLRMAIISDYKLGKELFQNPIFNGRRITEILDIYSHGNYGIVNADGEEWRKQSRFCKQQLKELGFGTRSMETSIHTEIDDVLQSWRDTKGKPFCPNKSFYLPILNTIWSILSGERVSTEDKELVPLVYRVYHQSNKIFDVPDSLMLLSRVSMGTGLRIMKWIPIFNALTAFFKGVEDLRDHFQIKIDARKKAGTISGAPSNLVDAYLKEAEKTTDPNSGFYGNTGNLNLLSIMVEFFIAGGDTSANQLNWSMLHLIRNPKIQQKIREEIHQVVGLGPDRRPSIVDRPKCPYTEAFIHEVLRYSPIALISGPHSTTEDTSIGPYFVEKGTILYLNIYHIQFDPKIWGDPQNFRPERFLSTDGHTFVKNEALCAFSLGQRRCVGEQLARDSLFLFISTICQQFVLSPDPRLKGALPPLTEERSAIHHVIPYHMVATPYSDVEQKEKLSN